MPPSMLTMRSIEAGMGVMSIRLMEHILIGCRSWNDRRNVIDKVGITSIPPTAKVHIMARRFV
jgi:hypothetical protein